MKGDDVEREVEENNKDFQAHDERASLYVVSPLDTRIDDKADEWYDVGEEVQLNLVIGIARLNHVLKCNVVSHDEAQEKEGHNFPVKVQRFRTVLEHVAEGVTHVDSHWHLILQHLHELTKGCIFLDVDHVVLRPLRLTIFSTVVDHICDETYFKQMFVLRHRAELKSELLLGGIVKVRAKKYGLVLTSMHPRGI